MESWVRVMVALEEGLRDQLRRRLKIPNKTSGFSIGSTPECRMMQQQVLFSESDATPAWMSDVRRTRFNKRKTI